MIEWVAGFCMLILLIIAIRQKQGRIAGILVMAAVLMAVVLTVTFIGRRTPDVDFLLGTDADDTVKGNDQGLESQSVSGSVFGYSDYTGYLDQCVQWLDYESFVACDYDGDGITDRVWRENIRDLGVADYRIEFGNGDLIELPETVGGIPAVRFLDLEGDGVREILFTETSGYSADPETYGQMALFRKSGEDYEMVELPEELFRADNEEQTFDKTMVRYQPSLSVRYEAAGEYLMRVTCPESENVEGLNPLDVMVDFTQEAWEMGGYDKFCSSGLPDSVVSCQVDILSLENGKDALLLYFGMLNEWCDDKTVVTLEWENGSLCIRDTQWRGI